MVTVKAREYEQQPGYYSIESYKIKQIKKEVDYIAAEIAVIRNSLYHTNKRLDSMMDNLLSKSLNNELIIKERKVIL